MRKVAAEAGAEGTEGETKAETDKKEADKADKKEGDKSKKEDKKTPTEKK